jgi:hypothetical protein
MVNDGTVTVYIGKEAKDKLIAKAKEKNIKSLSAFIKPILLKEVESYAILPTQ